jgi:hypothetical protein
VPLSPAAKVAEIKDAFRTMPQAQRRQVYSACAYLLPPLIRKEIQQRISQDTASPTASP